MKDTVETTVVALALIVAMALLAFEVVMGIFAWRWLL